MTGSKPVVVTRKQKSMALRRGLPYGAVMATSGASTVAGRCGLQALVTPLLGLAIAQALWILVAGVWRYRAEFRLGWAAWLVVGSAKEHTGVHTVPLGLAVIAGGLAGLSPAGPMPWLWHPAGICLGLAWLLTITCVSRFVGSLASHGLCLNTLDGTWFLVPAALLGTGMATQTLAAKFAGPLATLLVMSAFGAVLIGWVGYYLVTAAAFVRLRYFGLGGVPQAPWWIAMGCAGLAAAALGAVIEGPISTPLLQPFLVVALGVTIVFAVALCVPVIVEGTRFVLLYCRFRGPAVWPPTFSTAVLALGCLQAGEIVSSPLLRFLGLGAGLATLVFWAVTTGWNVKSAVSGLLHPGFQQRE